MQHIPDKMDVLPQNKTDLIYDWAESMLTWELLDLFIDAIGEDKVTDILTEEYESRFEDGG